MKNKLMQVLMLTLGFINVFYIAVIGTFVIYKDTNEDAKKVAKLSILVSLIFFAISTLLLFLLYMFNICGGNFSAYETIINIVYLVKIIVFVVLIVLVLCNKLICNGNNKKITIEN
ncbi:MAG: hypothetical protein ACI4TX_03730 [Christensenellales bacterium]